MGGLWLRIKVWTKVALFALLTVYVLTFIFQNIGPRVDLWVWYFTAPITMSVLLLALVSFLIGVLGTILSRTTYKTIRQMRELSAKTRESCSIATLDPLNGRPVMGRVDKCREFVSG